MTTDSFMDFAPISEVAEITKYSPTYLARLCREAGEQGAVISKNDVKKISKTWWIRRDVIPVLLEMGASKSEEDVLNPAEIAEVMGITRQWVYKILRRHSNTIANVKRDEHGRFYAPKKDVLEYMRLRAERMKSGGDKEEE